MSQSPNEIPVFRKEELDSTPLNERTYQTVYKPQSRAFRVVNGQVIPMGKLVVKFMSTTRIFLIQIANQFGKKVPVEYDITERIPSDSLEQLELMTRAEEIPAFISAISAEIFNSTQENNQS